jgi:hypothetical protein
MNEPLVSELIQKAVQESYKRPATPPRIPRRAPARTGDIALALIVMTVGLVACLIMHFMIKDHPHNQPLTYLPESNNGQ